MTYGIVQRVLTPREQANKDLRDTEREWAEYVRDQCRAHAPGKFVHFDWGNGPVEVEWSCKCGKRYTSMLPLVDHIIYSRMRKVYTDVRVLRNQVHVQERTIAMLMESLKGRAE